MILQQDPCYTLWWKPNPKTHHWAPLSLWQQVKLEMKTNPQLAAHVTVSKVKLLPFCVKLTRLSDAMICKFTASNKEPYKRSTQKQYYPASQQLKQLTIPVRKIQLSPGQSVTLHTPQSTSAETVPSGVHKMIKDGKRKRVISGHPSKQHQYTFMLQHHILKKRKTKTYLKCRIKGCTSAYVTYHSVCELNTHHRTYHAGITYKCQWCKKMLNTPTAYRWHMYGHGAQTFTCEKCSRTFVYNSKLRQHMRTHLKQKLFQCCYGKCTKKYKHPQDLACHTLTHTSKKFECELCDKVFKEKHLLRRHEAVHNPTNKYYCKICRKRFRHNNQLYRHRKSCYL